MDARPALPETARSQWRMHVVGALLAVIVVLATTFEIRDDRFVLAWPTRWVELLVLVTAAATLVAQRHPYLALAVAAILDAVPYWLPIAAPGYHLSLMFTVYFVMAHDGLRRSLPPVAAVLGAQVGLMAWHKDWTWTAMPVVYAGVSVLVPAALGFAAQSRVLAAEALRQQAIAAERTRAAAARERIAEERLRTAQDLHDSVAHQIAVMNLNAGVATQALRARPDEAESALRTVREAGRAVISSISDLLANLRHHDGDDEEAGARERPAGTAGRPHDLADLQLLVDEFRTLSPGLTASVQPLGGASASTSAGPLLYAVVREALTNAYKHGRHDDPAQLDVRLVDDEWLVDMTNVVADPRPGTGDRPRGFGLQGLRERVTAAGGDLETDPSGGRFAIRARIPMGAGLP